MSNRPDSFYKAEKKLYLGAMLCGLVFSSLFMWVNTVTEIYYYFYYLLIGYGIIYLISYGTKLFLITRLQKRSSNAQLESNVEEKNWIEKRLREIKFNRTIQTTAVFIGFAAVLVAAAGYNKSLIAGSGAGIILGSAAWLAIELISELQTREYLQFLNKD